MTVFAGCGGPASAQAPADASALFRSGTQAFAAGQLDEALTSFRAARDAGLAGPAVLYDIGVTEYKLGRYAQAERSFRELGAAYPAMYELAEYNRGLALTREDELTAARDAFERASRSQDPKIAGLADAMLARIAPPAAAAGGVAVAAGGAKRDPDRIRLLDVGLGYDDNVALIDESSLPLGATTDSPLVQLFGLLRGRPRDDWPLALDGSLYAVRYSDAGQYDQNALRLGAAYEWASSDWELEAEPYFSHTTLSGDSFERRIGASLAARRALGSGSLRVRLLHESIDDLEPQFDYIAGTRDRMSFDFRHRYARGRLSLGYALERNDRAGPGVSPDRNELYAGYEYYLRPAWSLEAQGFRRASRYASLIEPRDEDLTELSLTARRDLHAGWLLEGQCRFGHNASNDPLFSYDRTRVAIGLSKLF